MKQYTISENYESMIIVPLYMMVYWLKHAANKYIK